MPRFTPRPTLEYSMNNEVQPPLLAWIHRRATNGDHFLAHMDSVLLSDMNTGRVIDPCLAIGIVTTD